MEQKTCLAITLRVVPYEDRHKMVTALTENAGLITALAKNAVSSRRMGGAIDLFTASEWRYSEKAHSDLVFLHEAQTKKDYIGLRKDFEILTVASVMSEVLVRVTPKNSPEPDLFKLLANALAVLEDLLLPEHRPQLHRLSLAILNSFLAKILQWSGSQPRLQSCLQCETSLLQFKPEEMLLCSVPEAGYYCSSCRKQSSRYIQATRMAEVSFSAGQARPHAAHFEIECSGILDFYRGLSLPIRKTLSECLASRSQHEVLFSFLEALLVYHLPGLDRTPLRSTSLLK